MPTERHARAGTHPWIGHWQALAAALLFSTGGAGLKTDAFTALQMSSLRSGIAAVALLLWMRGQVQVSPAIAGAAGAYAITVTLYVAATKLTTAANAIFLQSSAPVSIVLLGPWLLGERLRRRDVPFLMVVAGGMWLAFVGSPPASHTAPDPPLGNLLALLCSVTWALTLISLRAVARAPSPPGAAISVVMLGNALASIVVAPALWPWPAADAMAWGTVVYLGVCQIGVAYLFLSAAVRRLPAIEVSLLLLLEPVLNPLWTWIVRGEEPGVAVMAGGAIILAATAWRALAQAQPNIEPRGG